jgi:hypothetical protein
MPQTTLAVHAIYSVYAVRRAASACRDLETVHTAATAPATVDVSDGASHGGGNLAESSGSGSGGCDGKQKAETLPSLISDTWSKIATVTKGGLVAIFRKIHPVALGLMGVWGRSPQKNIGPHDWRY